MPIDATCNHCEKTYKLSSKFAGKKAKCTNCGNPFSIPGKPAPAAPIANASGDYHEDDLMAGLSAAAHTESTATQSAATAALPVVNLNARCPLCNKAMEAAAVVCVGCGYNRKMGRTMQTSIQKEAPAARPAPAKSANGKSGVEHFGLGIALLALGLILSAISYFATVTVGGQSRYLVFTGLIVVGILRIIQGFFRMLTGK